MKFCPFCGDYSYTFDPQFNEWRCLRIDCLKFESEKVKADKRKSDKRNKKNGKKNY